MKNGNLIPLQASELDAVAGGAASVISALHNGVDLINSLGLSGVGGILNSGLDTAGKALPPLAAPISIPGIVSALGG